MNRLLVASLAAVALALPLSAGCSASDDGASPVDDPSKLSPPAKGEGFQLRTELFSVAPGEEVQDCYFFKIRDLAKAGGLDENQPVNLHRIQMVQKAGSHHMNLFRVKTIVKNAEGKAELSPENGPITRSKNGQGACFKSPLWADWPLIANTQQSGNVDWTFPDGVANVFQPDEWVMLQTHYVNASSQKTPEGGEVAVNFYTIPKDQVKAELGTIFATKQSIRVCKSNPTPTFNGTCQIKSQQPVNIIGANGHFHGRGTKFEIFKWDGTSIDRPADAARFYESNKWDEPPMLRSPDLNVQLPPNGGVFYSCSYQWLPPTEEAGGCAKLDELDKAKNKDATPDCCYTFGPIVERNEHCNAFVYYYPKQDNIFCN
jgi:hypothetical protein